MDGTLTRGLYKSNMNDTSYATCRPSDIAGSGEAMRRSRDARVQAALILVALIWAGMLIGVSFLATPAKFAAPSLALPVALDVGRHTFAVLNPIEIAGALLVAGLAVLHHRRWLLVPAGLAAAIVAVQTLWLLPALDARVETIIAGGAVPGSPLHTLYIALDLAKLVALLSIGGVLLFQAGGQNRRHEASRAATHRSFGAPS